MDMDMGHIDRLRNEIAQREAELAELKAQLASAEAEKDARESDQTWKWPMSGVQYERYSRQMIVPKFGLQGK
jgi:adenylyltransferase/sulfurtransferase